MFCEKCGNQVAEDATFCPKCGLALAWNGKGPRQPSASPPISPQTGMASKKKLFLALSLAGAGICLICGILLGTLLWLMAGRKPSHKDAAANLQTSAPAVHSTESPSPQGDGSTGQAPPPPYQQEYAKVLRDYWEGKKGVIYGQGTGDLAWDEKIGQNPVTGTYEYYYSMQDANGDGTPDLFVVSHPAGWWLDNYIVEGVYTYLNGALVTALDRTNDGEYNNYHSFCENMVIKISERSGGSYVFYERLNANGSLEDLGYGYWSNNGKFYIEDREVPEEELERWNGQYDKPSDTEWKRITEEELQGFGLEIPKHEEITETPVSLPQEQQAKMVYLLDQVHQSLLWDDYEKNVAIQYNLTSKEMGPQQKSSVLWVYECLYQDPRVGPDPSAGHMNFRNKAKKTDMRTIMTELFGSATDADMEEFARSYCYEQDYEFYYMSDGTGDFGAMDNTYFDSENVAAVLENGRLKITGTVMKYNPYSKEGGYEPYKTFIGYFIPNPGAALDGYSIDQLVIQ